MYRWHWYLQWSSHSAPFSCSCLVRQLLAARTAAREPTAFLVGPAAVRAALWMTRLWCWAHCRWVLGGERGRAAGRGGGGLGQHGGWVGVGEWGGGVLGTLQVGGVQRGGPERGGDGLGRQGEAGWGRGRGPFPSPSLSGLGQSPS